MSQFALAQYFRLFIAPFDTKNSATINFPDFTARSNAVHQSLSFPRGQHRDLTAFSLTLEKPPSAAR
jgi:hypothetical protein